MKKSLAVILMAVFLLLSGCGTEKKAGAVSENIMGQDTMDVKAETKEPVEIEFVQWWSSEGGGEYLDKLITDFEKDNPDIKVKLVTLPFGEVRTQVVASQATKTMPDIIAMNPPWTREFYDLGILAPLDDLMEQDENFNKVDYFQASFTPIEGKTYLAPVNSLGFFLFYNKTLFEEAGLELPKNWDDIVACAKALTDASKNQYGMTMTMSVQEASNGSILSLYPLLYAQNGRTLVDGKYTADTPEMLRALQLLEQLSKDGSILPGTTTKSESQSIEEFSTGNIGMTISHNGQILTIVNRNPELDFGIMPIPDYDGDGKPELRHHGWDVGISALSEHKEESWRFISYMINKENMLKMSNEMLKVPAMYGLEVDYLEKYPVTGDAVRYMNEYDMVEELMTMPKSAACWVELTKAGSEILQGVTTPEEAVTAVQNSWDELLGQ